MAEPGPPESYVYSQYRGEGEDMGTIKALIDPELSEPYSVFTYRYFLHQWPELCFIAYDNGNPFGTVVGKLDQHVPQPPSRPQQRGYIAMLVVEKPYRKHGIGSKLVRKCISAMISMGATEVTLEAEVDNWGALKLYGNMGFIRDKRLHRYYLNGNDAYRLKLILPTYQYPDYCQQPDDEEGSFLELQPETTQQQNQQDDEKQVKEDIQSNTEKMASLKV